MFRLEWKSGDFAVDACGQQCQMHRRDGGCEGEKLLFDLPLKKSLVTLITVGFCLPGTNTNNMYVSLIV